jgi:hypothetical protein
MTQAILMHVISEDPAYNDMESRPPLPAPQVFRDVSGAAPAALRRDSRSGEFSHIDASCKDFVHFLPPILSASLTGVVK